MFLRLVPILLCIITASVFCSTDHEVKTEEDLGVKYANRCEVCKVLATELQNRLEETGKVHDVIEIGYSLDDVQPKKKTKYQKSELRLIESLDGVCDKILEYNIHKERQDSTRFAKGMSSTFKTLHGLVDKGVKVDLGIPYELWDKPSAEITHLKTQCESLLEENEDAIEYWYWNLQGTRDLKTHLCEDNALSSTEYSCLYEKDNLKGDNGESFDSKEAEQIQESGSSKELKKENFEHNLNSSKTEYKDGLKSEDATKSEDSPKSADEVEREKAAKEKFVKLYEAGLLNTLDLNDPDTFIDYDELGRRKYEKAVSIDPVKQRKLLKQYIKEGIVKKPEPKKYVRAEPTKEFDFWSDDGGIQHPEDWEDEYETEDLEGDELILKREEL